MNVHSRDYRALENAKHVIAVLERLPEQDRAIAELTAAVEADRVRLLRKLTAGGFARLGRPGYL